MDIMRRRARRLRRQPTDAERRLWRYLRRRQLHGARFRRQHPIAGYIADFACIELGLVVELDGGQHGDRIVYDHARSAALAAAGFRVMRLWNHEVLSMIDEVLEAIGREVEALRVRGEA